MKKATLNTSTVINALKNGRFQTWDKSTQREALTINEDPSDSWSTPILEIIYNNGLVNKIPKDILDNKSILILRKEDGEVWSSLLHLCVGDEQWRDIPKHLLTEENLLIQDMWGNTPVQAAAMCGAYEFIIENLDLLTERTFKNLNKDNDTTLELLICTETCRVKDQTPPKEFLEILPKILNKFEENSLEKYYKKRVEKNTRIDKSIKDIFKLHIFKPLLSKMVKEEFHQCDIL